MIQGLKVETEEDFEKLSIQNGVLYLEEESGEDCE